MPGRSRTASTGQRRQRVERLVRPEAARELHAIIAAAGQVAVQVENRRLRAGLADPDHVRRGLAVVLPEDFVGEMLDRRLLKQRRGQQRLAARLFDPVEHPHRQQRIAAQREEIVADAHATARRAVRARFR